MGRMGELCHYIEQILISVVFPSAKNQNQSECFLLNIRLRENMNLLNSTKILVWRNNIPKRMCKPVLEKGKVANRKCVKKCQYLQLINYFGSCSPEKEEYKTSASVYVKRR